MMSMDGILIKRVLIILSTMVCIEPVFAKTVYFGRGAVNVTVPFYDDNKDMISEPTIFVFHKEVYSIDSKSKFIITPENRDEPDHRRLAVIPMVQSGSQEVSFTLANQEIIRVNLNIVKRSTVKDATIKFMPRSTLGQRGASSPKSTDMDFMKALIGGAKVIGVESTKMSKAVKCGSWGLSGKLIRVDKLNDAKAYTIRFKNKSSKVKYSFDDSKIYFKDQNLNRSILTHLTRSVLDVTGSKKNESVMTIVTDGNTRIWNGRICKLGEQVSKVTPQVQKKEKGSKK